MTNGDGKSHKGTKKTKPASSKDKGKGKEAKQKSKK